METNTTLNELAYRLIKLYRAEYKTTDSLSIEYIKDWIHSIRAMLLKQRLKNLFSHYSQAIIQDLGKIELESVDSSTVSEILSGKYMLRTKRRIPLVINTPGNLGAFTRIGPADRLGHSFKLVSYETALYSGNGKFNSKDIHTFILNGKLHVISKSLESFKTLGYLDVHGVFQSPELAARFKNPDWTHDDEYPIDKHLIDEMEKIIVDTKFNFIMQGVKDPISNQADNLTQPQSGRQTQEE